MAAQTNDELKEMAPTVAIVEDEEVHDEEKAFLLREDRSPLEPKQKGLSYKFWLSAAVNTVSTIAIVFILPRDFQYDTDEMLGVRQQSNLRDRVATACSGIFCSLPLRHHGWTAVRNGKSSREHLPGKERAKDANTPTCSGHDLQRCSPKCGLGILEHTVLPSGEDIAHTDRGFAELYCERCHRLIPYCAYIDSNLRGSGCSVVL